MIYTATLYNYIDTKLLKTQNINLLEETRRRTKHKHLVNHNLL